MLLLYDHLVVTKYIVTIAYVTIFKYYSDELGYYCYEIHVSLILVIFTNNKYGHNIVMSLKSIIVVTELIRFSDGLCVSL